MADIYEERIKKLEQEVELMKKEISDLKEKTDINKISQELCKDIEKKLRGKGIR